MKRLSNMFDINTFIHMLESILWSSHIRVQDPGLRPHKSRLWSCVTWFMMIWMSLSDGWLQSSHELSYVILLIIGWLWPYLGFSVVLFDGWLHPYLDLFAWSFSGWLCPCHRSCIIWQRSQFMYMYLYFLAGFMMVGWFPALIYKAFHPSFNLSLHALGGICYTTFCHCPCTPHSLILEDLYSEPRMLFLYGETPIMSLSMSRSFPFFICCGHNYHRIKTCSNSKFWMSPL